MTPEGLAGQVEGSGEGVQQAIGEAREGVPIGGHGGAKFRWIGGPDVGSVQPGPGHDVGVVRRQFEADLVALVKIGRPAAGIGAEPGQGNVAAIAPPAHRHSQLVRRGQGEEPPAGGPGRVDHPVRDAVATNIEKPGILAGPRDLTGLEGPQIDDGKPLFVRGHDDAPPAQRPTGVPPATGRATPVM